MYNCKACKATFIKPYERNIDAGIHYDRGVFGRNKVPTMKFCPECNSNNYEEVPISEAS